MRRDVVEHFVARSRRLAVLALKRLDEEPPVILSRALERQMVTAATSMQRHAKEFEVQALIVSRDVQTFIGAAFIQAVVVGVGNDLSKHTPSAILQRDREAL
jgi:hypothetical protein